MRNATGRYEAWRVRVSGWQKLDEAVSTVHKERIEASVLACVRTRWSFIKLNPNTHIISSSVQKSTLVILDFSDASRLCTHRTGSTSVYGLRNDDRVPGGAQRSISCNQAYRLLPRPCRTKALLRSWHRHIICNSTWRQFHTLQPPVPVLCSSYIIVIVTSSLMSKSLPTLMLSFSSPEMWVNFCWRIWLCIGRKITPIGLSVLLSNHTGLASLSESSDSRSIIWYIWVSLDEIFEFAGFHRGQMPSPQMWAAQISLLIYSSALPRSARTLLRQYSMALADRILKVVVA